MKADRQIHNVALIGFMATGKSTVGRLVADILGFDFVDTDQLIEAHAGKPIARIFAEEGESAFREQERQVVEELAHRQETVFATGGGLGADARHLSSLRAHALVVCLWSAPEVIWERARRHEHRPLLLVGDPLARIRELLAAREPVYRQADVLMDTAHRSASDVAQQVVYHFNLVRNSVSHESGPSGTS